LKGVFAALAAWLRFSREKFGAMLVSIKRFQDFSSHSRGSADSLFGGTKQNWQPEQRAISVYLACERVEQMGGQKSPGHGAMA
jgi:hypothetical protein